MCISLVCIVSLYYNARCKKTFKKYWLYVYMTFSTTQKMVIFLYNIICYEGFLSCMGDRKISSAY